MLRTRFWKFGVVVLSAAFPFMVAAPAAAQFTVVNVIPSAQSGETDQNSEVSIGVNPLNRNQMVIGAFVNGVDSPLYNSSNGGATWTQFQTIPYIDNSIAWSNSGKAYTTPLLSGSTSPTMILPSIGNPNPSSGTPFIPNNGGAISGNLDQPWVRATQVGGQDHIYIGYNDLGNSRNTASVLFSQDSGTTWTNTVVERNSPGAGQDAPSVRVAVNGDTVYAGMIGWDQNNGNGTFESTIRVVRDSTGGSGGFNDLGGGLGSTVALTTTPLTLVSGVPPTLGSERVGSDLAIAVDPNNANHVYVAYVSVDPGTALDLQVHVSQSTDGGVSFSDVFTTPLGGFQAAEPALAVDAKGDVGLLYNANQNGITGTQFTFTSNDFTTSTTSILAVFTDGVPAPVFDPYLGDFTTMTAIGNTFYGSFASTNQADGIVGFFPQGVTFQRNFTGTVNDPSFELLDTSGSPVAPSIDPYYFSFDAGGNAVPEPATLTLLGLGVAGLAAYRWRRREVQDL